MVLKNRASLLSLSISSPLVLQCHSGRPQAPPLSSFPLLLRRTPASTAPSIPSLSLRWRLGPSLRPHEEVKIGLYGFGGGGGGDDPQAQKEVAPLQLFSSTCALAPSSSVPLRAPSSSNLLSASPITLRDSSVGRERETGSVPCRC
ncbi:putative E3 ubiquitin-protein ligase XB3-like [Iris pallida]|uniref:E3 ubiquitin-protein ligase XB3-like n=1 Tax=Iris pallida TaxID=29817 RepID=A0AAX6FDL7_IRIPA|nr:putative E3 ubiquitin-protein ligase XB3-like [Iris pallida]